MNEIAAKTAALTGATGFIGRYLIDALRADGWNIRALTRRDQRAESCVEWIRGDLENPAALAELMAGADFVIHAAGVTKALNRKAFHAVNAESIARILTALEGRTPHFLYLSSLAAREPHLSHYAASKSAGEDSLKQLAGDLPWTILRPSAVYGPGDREIVKLLKLMRRGFAIAPGHPDNRFSIIHARDVAGAALACITEPALLGRTIEIDDDQPGGYSMRDIADIVRMLLSRNIRPFTIPKSVLSTLGTVNTGMSALTRKPAMLTRGKARELAHPDWVANTAMKPDPAIWTPKIDLRTGLAETLDWYRQKGHI